jgi:hypothetical protein
MSKGWQGKLSPVGGRVVPPTPGIADQALVEVQK